MTAQALGFRQRLVEMARKAYAPAPSLDDWCARHRRVVGGARPGKWDPDNAPCAREPMRAYTDEGVEEIALVAPSQLLKSELVVSCALYSMVHQQPTLFYEPDITLLRKFVADRVRPSLIAMGFADAGAPKGSGDSRFLKQRDSSAHLRFHGLAELVGLTPGLKTGKSAYTARIALVDELDRMETTDLPAVVDSRTITYAPRRKVVYVSTPTVEAAGTIMDRWTRGSRGVYRGRCPHCGELASLDWGRVVFETDQNGLWVPPSEGGAQPVLACEGCGAAWSEHDRQLAIRGGAYVHEHPEHRARTFHVPGPAHQWRTLGGMVETGAVAYREAITRGDWEPYIRWTNEVACKPWQDAYRGLSGSRMKRATYSLGARGQESEGELDPRALLVVVGADVGLRYIKAEWIAVGWDPERQEVLTWGLHYQTFGGAASDTIDDPALRSRFYEAVRGKRWRVPGGQRPVGAMLALIDAGYQTDTVRDWCTEWQQREAEEAGRREVGPFDGLVLPWKSFGLARADAPLVDKRGSVSSRQKLRKLPVLVQGDGTAIKELIYDSVLTDKLREPELARSFWPADRVERGYDQTWFDEFCSEVKATKRVQGKKAAVVTHWEWRAGFQSKNHALDCRTYGWAAALLLVYPRGLADGLARLRPPGAGGGGGSNVVEFPPRGNEG